MGHRSFHSMLPLGDQAIALEANAASARLALGCAYSDSEEFEADRISARRAAGMFGGPCPWHALAVYAVGALVFAAILYLKF